MTVVVVVAHLHLVVEGLRGQGSLRQEERQVEAAFVVVDCVLQVANADAAAGGSRWMCVPGCVCLGVCGEL